MRCPCYLTI